MKLKTLATAALITFSLTFSLSAYSRPGDPNTHWQSYCGSNLENAEGQQFGMVSTMWPFLQAQEKIQEELIQLNEETKGLIQVLADRDQIAYGKKRICLDPKKCPQYSLLKHHLCIIRGDC